MRSITIKVLLGMLLFAQSAAVDAKTTKSTWEMEPFEEAELQVGPYGGLQMELDPDQEMQWGNEEADPLLW